LVASYPRSVFQTHWNPGALPAKLALNFQKFAPGWTRRVFNDSECLDFLRLHFQQPVTDLFTRLQHGAHKADLFRYAVMYIHGGVYLDIKTELIAPLDWVLDNASTFLVLSFFRDTVYNGIMATPSRQPLFYEMVAFMVAQGTTTALQHYNYNIKQLYASVRVCLPSWDTRAKKCAGAHTCSINGTVLRFAVEELRDNAECYDGPDRYKMCVFVTDRCEKVFKVRYADYPFKRSRTLALQ